MPNEGSPHASPTIAVLVPCLDEEASIARVVGGFRQALPTATVYVYDNGSADDTAKIASEAGAVVRVESRPGKGVVVRRMLADVDADVYVLVDGDATYDPGIASDMVRYVLEGRIDMVVARRVTVDGTDERSGHQLGNRIFNRFVAVIFGRHFSDVFSGYRAVSRRMAKSFPAESSGFEVETEMTVHALDLDLPTVEVDGDYRPRSDEDGESKLRTFRDGLRISATILRLYRQTRPLSFFFWFALLATVAAWALGTVVIVEFVQTGVILHIPTAILATGLQILGVLLLVAGLVLDSVASGRREAKRLSYLSFPAPSE